MADWLDILAIGTAVVGAGIGLLMAYWAYDDYKKEKAKRAREEAERQKKELARQISEQFGKPNIKAALDAQPHRKISDICKENGISVYAKTDRLDEKTSTESFYAKSNSFFGKTVRVGSSYTVSCDGKRLPKELKVGDIIEVY